MYRQLKLLEKMTTLTPAQKQVFIRAVTAAQHQAAFQRDPNLRRTTGKSK